MIEYKLSDYLNAINWTKVNLLDGDDLTWEKKFPPYVINRCLSQHIDSIMMANEMNQRHGLNKRLQFHFLLNSIRKRKRFGGKWTTTAKSKNLEYVKEYYGYSNAKAKVDETEKVVYISCNSATQARDLALMKEDYVIEKSQAVDMFPQTHHVENVVLLKRRK